MHEDGTSGQCVHIWTGTGGHCGSSACNRANRRGVHHMLCVHSSEPPRHELHTLEQGTVAALHLVEQSAPAKEVEGRRSARGQ
eukprot:350697-Chlamydomonas_euryale.AAC.1